MPFSLRLARTNASIGVLAQPPPTSGTRGRTSARSDHQASGSALSLGPSLGQDRPVGDPGPNRLDLPGVEPVARLWACVGLAPAITSNSRLFSGWPGNNQFALDQPRGGREVEVAFGIGPLMATQAMPFENRRDPIAKFAPRSPRPRPVPANQIRAKDLIRPIPLGSAADDHDPSFLTASAAPTGPSIPKGPTCRVVSSVSDAHLPFPKRILGLVDARHHPPFVDSHSWNQRSKSRR